jgi:holliday junction DNA helicase RuvB
VGKLRNIMSSIVQEAANFKKNNGDNNIFKDIYGHDDIKQIFQMALKAEHPVHILLTGEPGCGKTQFLENIKGHYKDKSYFTIGAHSTKAGMLDYLFEYRPRILLIDEIEHMPPKDQAVLLSLMQSQIISETKHKKTRQTQLKCSVFATSNSTKKMLDPLLSRFVIIPVERYSYQEFKEIAMKVLTEKENIEDENLAATIIDEIWEKNKVQHGATDPNIRDIIKIARLAHNVHDVKLVIRAIMPAANNKTTK